MSAAALLVVRVRLRTSRAVLLEAVGELDLATSGQLRSALRRVIGTPVIALDLAALDFCDMAGLRTLAEAHHLAKAAGGTLRLVAPSAAVTRVLELAELPAYFEIHPDGETALDPG